MEGMVSKWETPTEVETSPRSTADWIREAVATIQKLLAADSNSPEDLESELGSPAVFAEIVFRSIPKRSSWDKVVGPVFTTEQLQMRDGVSRQAIFDRVRRHTLLGLRTLDKHTVYPTFQFEGRKVLGGLSKVLKITAGEVDDWTLASWLVAEQPSLGVSVIEALRQSGPSTEVIQLANDAVQHWSR
jgi:hypothetical protein